MTRIMSQTRRCLRTSALYRAIILVLPFSSNAFTTIQRSARIPATSAPPSIAFSLKKQHSRADKVSLSSTSSTSSTSSFDVIVIGSGIGGLSCASLLAATKTRSVLVLESHYELGGCAHEFAVDMNTGKTIPSSSRSFDEKSPSLFRFEAGPSLYAGISPDETPNPLKHVYQMIEEEPEWITYDKWGAFLPEAPEGYEMSIGAENFITILETYGGPTAVRDWESLAESLRPLAKEIMRVPATVIRDDWGLILTLIVKYPVPFFKVIGRAKEIVAPFDLEEMGIEDAFLKNYLDMLAFLLQGLPANQTLTAVMAYMVEDFYREDAVMDFPKGGSRGMIDALARGVTKWKGCEIRKNVEVKEVIVENGRAVGVLLNNNQVIKARQAVVSNTDLFQTYNLVKTPHEQFDQEREYYLGSTTNDEKNGVSYCKSFMHLHLGVKADLIPEDSPPQWTVVRDWSQGIDAPGNMVVVSVASKLDPSLAPEGYHVIHAYTAGNEPYEAWERFEHLMDDAPARNNDKSYQDFKTERAQPIWDAIAKRAPNVKPGTAVVEYTGTPLTHARYLKRHRGNYGLAIPAGGNVEFPKVRTPIEGYHRCGDSTTAGIGIPAVAASGAQCANSLMSVWEQLELNKKIKMQRS